MIRYVGDKVYCWVVMWMGGQMCGWSVVWVVKCVGGQVLWVVS